MIQLEELVRPHLKELIPYSSARDEFSGSANIFLDANENSYGSVLDDAFHRYPDPLQMGIKQRIAQLKEIHPDRIFIGNGSDEVIDLLIRAFCEPDQDCIVTMPPTYGMYKVSASINNVRVGEVPLTEDFQINENLLRVSLHKDVKLFFICSPNNPTGNSLNRDILVGLLNDFEGIVVIDEAYIDFSEQESMTALVDQFDNLVVLQTFSKAWGLASLRVGTAYAQKGIIDILNKIKPPYNISGLTQKMILEALEQVEKKNDYVKKILKEREHLVELLGQVDVVQQIYPSDANFVLVRVENANDIYQFLIDHKIVVRNRSNVMMCDNCLRITVGTSEENQQLTDTLKKYKAN